jgi:hypothetical protein
MTSIKIILAVIAAILLYVLSIGPAIRYAAHSPALNAFYSPLAWLYHNTAFDAPLEWYLGLWGVK